MKNTRQKILEKLEYMRTLEEGWDGEAAPPINPAIINLAKNVVENIDPKTNPSLMWGYEYVFDNCVVVPCPNANLQLEWEIEGHYLEIEFETPTSIGFLHDTKSGISVEDGFYIDENDLNGRINWVVAKINLLIDTFYSTYYRDKYCTRDEQ